MTTRRKLEIVLRPPTTVADDEIVAHDFKGGPVFVVKLPKTATDEDYTQTLRLARQSCPPDGAILLFPEGYQFEVYELTEGESHDFTEGGA